MQNLIEMLSKATELNAYMIELVLNEMVALERRYSEERGMQQSLDFKAISPSQIILLTANMGEGNERGY